MTLQERNELIGGYFKRLTDSGSIAYDAEMSAARDGVEGIVRWNALMTKIPVRMPDGVTSKVDSLKLVTTSLLPKNPKPNVLTNIDFRYDFGSTSYVEERINKAVKAQEAIIGIINEKEQYFRQVELTSARRVEMHDIKGIYSQVDYSEKLPFVLAKNIGGVIVEDSEVIVSTCIDHHMKKVIPCLELQIWMLKKSLPNK
jgi:hypothetical protein